MPADSATVRAAALEELEIAADLRAAMAAEMGNDWDREYPGWRTRFAGYFRDKQRAGLSQTYFAVRDDDGAVVGCAIFSVLDEYRAVALQRPRGFANSVYVVPPWRRRGLARALMLEGIAWLRKQNCAMVRLRSSREGRPLYESLGFVAGSEMELPL